MGSSVLNCMQGEAAVYKKAQRRVLHKDRNSGTYHLAYGKISLKRNKMQYEQTASS